MTDLTEDEILTLQAYDALAKIWANNHKTDNFYAEEMAILKKLLPSGKILEIGSGGGRDAAELTKLGYEYLGTDVSSGLIKQATIANPDLEFIQTSIYDLNFTNQFDGFWCVATLLHIPRNRINEALQVISRILKVGGVGFITIKEGNGEGLEKRVPHDGNGRLFVYWQNSDFQKILKENGYEVLKYNRRPFNERATWLAYHVRKLR